VFWDLLKQAALREGIAVNALVARIDAERIEAQVPPGLASAIRVWLMNESRNVQSAPTRSTSAPSSESFSSSRS
jgi:predicted DNA-binding ribbon-helix-helix protein